MVRLLHISDLHHGMPFVPRFGEAVLRTAAERRPDAVIASGDLVELGELPSHWRRAAAYLARFDAPVITVPGNHDIARFDVWHRLRAPLGLYRGHILGDRDGRGVGRAVAPLDRVTRVGDATVIALSTPRRWTFDVGYVSPEQLELARGACEHSAATDLRVVVMHHGLRQLARSPLRDCVRGARLAVWSFADMGVDVVLSGHNHFPHLERLGQARGFLWSQAGTATTRRYHRLAWRKPSVTWIETDGDTLRIDWLFPDVEVQRFVPGAWHRFARKDLARLAA